MSSDVISAYRSTRFHLVTGVTTVVVLVGGLLTWGVMASIAGAVIAPGTVAVETNAKTVQHLEGGIVGKILVRDGEHVNAGDLLIRLDDTVQKASLAIVENQLIELIGRGARLVAERNGDDEIAFAGGFDELTDASTRRSVQDGQVGLFEARRRTREGQIEQLQQGIVQLEEEIKGLDAQAQARERQIALIGQEVTGLEALFEQGHASITRLLALKRESANLEGERGRIVADIARARGAIGENRLKVLQIDTDIREKVLTELREVETRLAELRERRIAIQEQLRRIDIRAPRTGIVHELAVHTIGGVVSAAVPIMKIIPESDRLIVEARVEPQNIDDVHVDQEAVIRFAAFNQRTTPEVNGAVITVSGDRTVDAATAVEFYLIKIEISETELQRLGDRRLVSGMPVEVFIATGERSALSYLLKPFTDQVMRAFREE